MNLNRVRPLLSAALLLAVGTTQAVDIRSTDAQILSYQVRNQKHGDLLRPRDASNRDGTPIVLYPAQAWKCLTWKFVPAGNSSYQLQNHFTSKTLGAAAGGQAPKTAVVQVPLPADKAKTPAWKFKLLADGAYQILDVKSGLSLTAQRGDDGEVRTQLAPWNNTDEQKWQVLDAPAKLDM